MNIPSKYFDSKEFKFNLRVILIRTLKIKSSTAKELIENMKEQSNDETLQAMKKVCKPKSKPNVRASIKSYKGNAKQIYIELFGKKPPQNIKLLDIGCGNCYFTCAMKNYLRLNEDNVYGLDIIKKENDLIKNYYMYDGANIPFNANTFNIITMFQVLHHIPPKQLSGMLVGIHNILTDDGYLIIKEHDCTNDEMTMLIDIQHYLYTIRGYDAHSKGTYKSKQEWHALLKKCGFKQIASFAVQKDVTNSFYALYQKNKKVI